MLTNPQFFQPSFEEKDVLLQGFRSEIKANRRNPGRDLQENLSTQGRPRVWETSFKKVAQDTEGKLAFEGNLRGEGPPFLL